MNNNEIMDLYSQATYGKRLDAGSVASVCALAISLRQVVYAWLSGERELPDGRDVVIAAEKLLDDSEL